jgi:dTMP kinase
MMQIPRGWFLALEGPDGSGKTTQAARLVEWLRTRFPNVVPCRDPGGTALGDRLRSLLLDRSSTVIGLRSEMLLYMASRAQLVEEIIRPALNEGAVVVSDRFILSNVVYQGYAGGLKPDEVWSVGRSATGGLLPDLTLLIDVPPEVARTRIGTPRDRIEDRPDDYRNRVRDGYLQAIAGLPSPHASIDGSREPDAVAEQIRNEVARALGITSRA